MGIAASGYVNNTSFRDRATLQIIKTKSSSRWFHRILLMSTSIDIFNQKQSIVTTECHCKTKGGTTIIADHIALNLAVSESSSCSDFNGRTKDWYKSHNTNGSTLRACKRLLNVNVSAPQPPTFKNQSVVASFLWKYVPPSNWYKETQT